MLQWITELRQSALTIGPITVWLPYPTLETPVVVGDDVFYFMSTLAHIDVFNIDGRIDTLQRARAVYREFLAPYVAAEEAADTAWRVAQCANAQETDDLIRFYLALRDDIVEWDAKIEVLIQEIERLCEWRDELQRDDWQIRGYASDPLYYDITDI